MPKMSQKDFGVHSSFPLFLLGMNGEKKGLKYINVIGGLEKRWGRWDFHQATIRLLVLNPGHLRLQRIELPEQDALS